MIHYVFINSLFKQIENGERKLPSPDLVSDMYFFAVDFLASNGFQRYEVSNFARDPENQSQHNLNYWRGRDYLGVGPGAHARYLTCMQNDNPSYYERTVNALTPLNWIESVEKHGHG